MRGQAAVLSAAALALFAAPAAADHRELLHLSGGDAEQEATWGGATPDGAQAFFTTPERLVPEDTDAVTDVYMRRGDVTTLVSADGPGAGSPSGVGFLDVSRDGRRVVLGTTQRLTGEDEDNATDFYLRADGETRLITRPAEPPLFAGLSFYAGMSADGERIFFSSLDPFVVADDDFAFDFYAYEDGALELLSPDTGADARHAFRQFASADGMRAFFLTRSAIDPADTDGADDIYLRAGGTTTLVTTLQTADPRDATLDWIARAGDRVVFHTDEALVAGDGDDQRDLYAWADGPIALLTPGTALPVDFQRASADGRTVAFTTYERLAPTDADDFSDLYVRDAAGLDHASTGPAGGSGGPDDLVVAHLAPDGTRAYFTTRERLTADDLDFAADVYARAAGVTTRVSIGAQQDHGPFDASFAGASPDGSRVVFQSTGPLAAGDPDDADDLFERHSGATALVTGGTAAADARYAGHSEDARTVFFTTPEALLPGDADAAADLYASRVNASPAVTVSTDPLVLTAGGPAAPLDPGLRVDDPDTATLIGATLTLDGGAGVLGFPGAPGLSPTSGNGTLSITGSASPAAYEAALRSVTLTPAGAAAEGTVGVTVTDGIDTSRPVTRALRVMPPQTAPPGFPPPGGVGRPLRIALGPLAPGRRVTIRVSGDGPVRPVKVRLRRNAPGGCASWSPRRRALRAARCDGGGLYVDAGLGPLARWRVPGALPPGRYVLAVKVGDARARGRFTVSR